MGHAKVAVSIEEGLITKADFLVRRRQFNSRSQLFQIALEEKISRLDKTRLARECAKLRDEDRKYEQALAEEGLSEDIKLWPEY